MTTASEKPDRQTGLPVSANAGTISRANAPRQADCLRSRARVAPRPGGTDSPALCIRPESSPEPEDRRASGGTEPHCRTNAPKADTIDAVVAPDRHLGSDARSAISPWCLG